MIEMHLHILPGIDDRPETIEESLALARTLELECVHSAIATPHSHIMHNRLSIRCYLWLEMCSYAY